MMQAGKYYVGDLCYVMHGEWDECCKLFFEARADQGCNEGEFTLKDGRRFASYNTAYGDGEYEDQYGNRYLVDAGLIGCIKVDDIHLYEEDNHLSGGNIINFPEDFECSYEYGVIRIGHIHIDTDPQYDDEYDEEYQYQD